MNFWGRGRLGGAPRGMAPARPTHAPPRRIDTIVRDMATPTGTTEPEKNVLQSKRLGHYQSRAEKNDIDETVFPSPAPASRP